MTYLASCRGSCNDFDPHDPSTRFFKIHEEGYSSDAKIKIWFQEKFISNNSTLGFRIPKNIPSGEYIVRHELLSLHAVEAYGAEV